MPITRKMLAALDWTTVFEATVVKVLKAKGLGDDFAIIHETASTGRVRIRFNAFGTKFDSPSEAIKHYNKEEAKRLLLTRHCAGSD